MVYTKEFSLFCFKMKLTVTKLTDEIFILDVNDDLTLESFKGVCELECRVPKEEILLVHDGVPLMEDKKSLNQLGLKSGDMIVLQQWARNDSTQWSSDDTVSLPLSFFSKHLASLRSEHSPDSKASCSRYSHHSQLNSPGLVADDPAHIRDLFLANPDQLALMKQNNPRLADAINNLADFTQVLQEQMYERQRREDIRAKLMRAHPFDSEAQRLIAEEIRQKNIEANMEAALEYSPETFGTVTMLYIDCKVNGSPVKAFIDSGAQTTIMSSSCADRVNIMRLVDTRWAGIAKGVGVQRIIGRIHMVQVAIEKDYLTTSFSVLVDQPMDMLLGLDLLRRYQCCIDLQKNVLRIGTTGTETPFLPESQLPTCARLHNPSHSQNKKSKRDHARNK